MTAPSTDELTRDLCEFVQVHVSTGDASIEPDTDLVMTGLVDSLGVVVIVEWLEDRLSIEIDPADVVVEHFETVAAMVAFVTSA